MSYHRFKNGLLRTRHRDIVSIKPYVTNSLWPSDVIWRHRSGSTMVPVDKISLNNSTIKNTVTFPRGEWVTPRDTHRKRVFNMVYTVDNENHHTRRYLCTPGTKFMSSLSKCYNHVLLLSNESNDPITSLVCTSQQWDLYANTAELLARFHEDVIQWKHFPRYWPFRVGMGE